jgi:hypothetical protein
MKLIAAAVFAALVFTAPAEAADHCTSGKCARTRVKHLVADRVFIKHTETGSIGNPSSLDQRLHVCRGGDFIYDSVSSIEATGTSSLQRTTGTWTVRKAHLSRNGKRGKATLRGEPDGGGPATTVRIRWKSGMVWVDGAAVIAGESDLC